MQSRPKFGFNSLCPVRFLPRARDISSQKNMKNVTFQGCEDLEDSHINEAIQNNYNIVAMGWTKNDSEFDPSFLFYYRAVSTDVYFTFALPNNIVAFRV